MGRRGRELSRPVTGTAFRIYLLMLSKGSPMGVREIQHVIGLKSASTVKYHLDRLRSAGLVRQLPDGRYEALRTNPLLTSYVFILNTPVPRIVPVAIGYAAFILTYSLLTGVSNPVLTVSAIAFAAYAAFEGWRFRRLLKYLSGGE